MPRDDATLLDILKACRLTISFLGDLDRAQFLADPKTQAAVEAIPVPRYRPRASRAS